jgi:dihydropteroate synthase
MGVLNLTPDSFSDGGRFTAQAAAERQARLIAAQGADILDLGGQSTRPGAEDISAEEEIRRLIPILHRLLAAPLPSPFTAPEGKPSAGSQGPILSIDTFRAAVAEAALEAGAHWINDVSGGRREPEILKVVATAGCPYVLTHSRGDSRTMDSLACYGDVVREVREELLRATDAALAAGVRPAQLIWDPGLGFAKTTPQNLALLRGLAQMRGEGFPLLLGPSRKRFIGAVLDEPRARARLWGTAAACCRAIASGADIVRVHDVGAIVQTCRMADALWR